MRGTVRLFRLFGINVFLHWSFMFLVGFLMYITYSQHGNVTTFFSEMLYVTLLFVCVIMHEYGHALAARRYGIDTYDITVLPIGGVARLTHIPKNPVEELVVVFAGPLVNLAIYLVLSFFCLVWFKHFPNVGDIFTDRNDDFDIPEWGKFTMTIALANLFLMLFNLLPAFPMDGGRIFRALLCFATTRERATFYASILGRILAVGIFAFAVYDEKPLLALLAIAVFWAARTEYKQVRNEDRFENHRVKNVFKPKFESLNTTMLMGDAIIKSEDTKSQVFLVFNNEQKISGYLDKDDVNDARKNSDLQASVGAYTNQIQVIVKADTALKKVTQEMNAKNSRVAVVEDDFQILGTISFDEILHYINA